MLSKGTLEQAASWINECLSCHEHCIHAGNSSLPTRIIDVGAMNEIYSPKLVLSDGRQGRYATLSYCWGGPQESSLTTSTLADKQKNLSMAELPRTITDAITITRSLGLRYLWIDSLCIIQDSPSDKAIEISRMDRIYNSSILTISAAAASSCRAGFLQTCNPPDPWEPYRFSKIDFLCPNGKKGSLYIERSHLYYATREPLNGRGWALQERLLSPRLLVFGSWQMYWQCQSVSHCAGGKMSNFSPDGMERLSNSFFTDTPADSGSTYDNWLDIVQEYVRRALTSPTDKLPALSGIAARFQRILGGMPYRAGHWDADLQRSLSWQVGDPQDSRPAEYRGPTWSWVSVDGDIFWERRAALSSTTQIISCEIEPLDHRAPLGRVQSGILELQGLVQIFDWDGGEELYDDAGVPFANIRVDLSQDVIHDHHKQLQVFHMGRDQEGVNGFARHVASIAVTQSTALVLEQQADGMYLRLGLMDFDFVDGIDFLGGMERFFVGSRIFTLSIR